jgi:hypothetical protein
MGPLTQAAPFPQLDLHRQLDPHRLHDPLQSGRRRPRPGELVAKWVRDPRRQQPLICVWVRLGPEGPGEEGQCWITRG